MDKFTRTITLYLSSIVLQILCFFIGKHSINEYNSDNISKIWIRLFKPSKPEIVPSKEWFSFDNWSTFNIIYYDSKELIVYLMLFTFTALSYLTLSDSNISKYIYLFRFISIGLSLLSGYLISYEVISLVNEFLTILS